MYQAKMERLKICVLIPTYNNAQTLAQVIEDVSEYTASILVINDGSTDETASILQKLNSIKSISYPKNVGKGHALKKGLAWAYENGFDYAISIDSDGQHFADDIPVFFNKIEESPNSMLIGARNLQEENMPKGNTFGNKFSNFWFRLETGIDLPDTQSGFRLYPLAEVDKLSLFTNKYEFEIEVMVKLAWQNVPVIPVPIKVFYAKGEERISHFRPFKDFFRITVLNTYLVVLALLWHIPKRFFSKLNRKSIGEFVDKNLLDPNESALKKSLSAAFGVFMGIIPIWGYQLASAIFLAHVFKLNKAIVILAANISIPPFIPFLLYGSLKMGLYLRGENSSIFDSELSFDTMKQHFPAYLLGSFVFAVLMAILLGAGTWVVITFNRRRSS